MDEATDEELLARAIHAYFARGRKLGGTRDFPGNESAVEEYAEKRYVVLRNGNGVLEVYRIRNDGLLKSLKRWPESLVVAVAHPTGKKPPGTARNDKKHKAGKRTGTK